jgi:F-type H+-transporting ATPase subunit O
MRMQVVSAFCELMDESRGVLHVVITSAEPLKKKTLESVHSSVLSMAGPGKQIHITTKEDPSIIGGLQILVGDRFLDLSVSSRIAEVTSALESSEL